VALTSETGATAASMLYDAWGNVRVSTGTGHGKYRFTGAELDTASGLYHMGARFYDPSIGRWLSEDPAKSFEPASLNFYAYVANNPLILIDPRGLESTASDSGCMCPTLQEQVKEWLEQGEEYAKQKLHEFYQAMAEIAKMLDESNIGLNMLVLGSLTALAMTIMPNPKSSFGQLILDFLARGSAWVRVGVSVMPATARRFVGATSFKLVFMRLEDGATFGYHFFVGEHGVFGEHLREGTFEELQEWLAKPW